MSAPTVAGRVLQVNVSPSGVPKRPVDRAWVGPLGLEGDGHAEDTVHGGPHRAVCLFAIEAIRRVAAEGHPIYPGSAGENLTTEGVEWSTLPIGTRARVGERLVIELSAPDGPCTTIRDSFTGGRSARISILTHPTDSRMYARVIDEGEVRPGNPIAILPADARSRAGAHALLERLDAASRKASLATWSAARAAGLEVRVLDEGELAFAGSSSLPGPMFNLARGLTSLPNLASRGIAFFREAGVTGWLELDPETAAAAHPDGIPGAAGEPDLELGVWAIEPDRVVPGPAADGLTIRRVGADEAETWARTLLAAEPLPAPLADAWLALAPHLVREPHVRLYLAELEGLPVAASGLHVGRRVGWLRSTGVIPQARGRGIQRALIAHRAAQSEAAGFDLVGAQVEPGSASETNVRRAGLVEIGRRILVRVEPAG